MNDDPARLLSLARTSLTDPLALDADTIREALWGGHEPGYDPEAVAARHPAAVLFAVDMIDQAMSLLDVELRPVVALRTGGKLVAAVADAYEAEGQDRIARELHSALDTVDEVLNELDPG